LRNFTREGAAVASGHTQGSSYPYPRAQAVCRGAGATGRRGARLLRGGRLPGHTPGGAATRQRAAYTVRGAGYPAGYVRGATGRTSGTATRGGRIPGGGATGQNRRLSGAHVGGYRGAGYPVGYPGGLPRRRRLPVPGRLPGGAIPGRGLPGGAARRHTQPPAAATPGGLPGHSW